MGTTSFLKIVFVLILYFQYQHRCYCEEVSKSTTSQISSTDLPPSTVRSVTKSTRNPSTGKHHPTTTAKPSSSTTVKHGKETTTAKPKPTPKHVTTHSLTSKSSTAVHSTTEKPSTMSTVKPTKAGKPSPKHATTQSPTSKTSTSTPHHPSSTTKAVKSTTEKRSTTVHVKPTTTAKSSTMKHTTASKQSTKLRTTHEPTSKSTKHHPTPAGKHTPSTQSSTSQQFSTSTTSAPIRQRRDVHPVKPVLPSDPFTGGNSSNPGAILKFNKQLLVQHVNEACRKAEKEKSEGRSASDDIVFDLPSGKVVISELFLTYLSLPLSLIDVSPPNLLVWFTDKARLSATGSWIYVPSNASMVNHTGKFSFPPTGFIAGLNTSLGRSDEDRPAISKVDCNIVMDSKSNVIFSAPSHQARLAIEKFESNLTHLIKNELESDMCYFTGYILQAALNNILGTFHTRIELSDFPKISLDYSLIADPFVDPQDFSINALLKGSIIVDEQSVDFYPHDMVSLAHPPKMVTTLFSDYMLNSLLASAYQADWFSSANIAAMYSGKVAELLSLNCSNDKLCLGSVLPYNSSSSDDFADLVISLNSTPSAIFLESGGFLQVNGSFFISINNSTGKFNHYSSPFSLVASLQPSIRDDNLYSLLSMEARVVEVNMTNASKLILVASPDKKVQSLMTPIFQEIINKPLRHGIPVPMFLNNKIIHLGADEFAYHNRTLSLAQNPV